MMRRRVFVYALVIIVFIKMSLHQYCCLWMIRNDPNRRKGIKVENYCKIIIRLRYFEWIEMESFECGSFQQQQQQEPFSFYSILRWRQQTMGDRHRSKWMDFYMKISHFVGMRSNINRKGVKNMHKYQCLWMPFERGWNVLNIFILEFLMSNQTKNERCVTESNDKRIDDKRK